MYWLPQLRDLERLLLMVWDCCNFCKLRNPVRQSFQALLIFQLKEKQHRIQREEVRVFWS